MTNEPARDISDDVRLVYATYPSLDAAHAAGRSLVECKLAACINILPGMTSIYAWQGRIETAGEVVILVKTRAALASAVVAAIKRRHTYDVPACVVLPVVGGNPEFLAWICSETTAV